MKWERFWNTMVHVNPLKFSQGRSYYIPLRANLHPPCLNQVSNKNVFVLRYDIVKTRAIKYCKTFANSTPTLRLKSFIGQLFLLVWTLLSLKRKKKFQFSKRLFQNINILCSKKNKIFPLKKVKKHFKERGKKFIFHFSQHRLL